jgi:hypothetical protein
MKAKKALKSVRSIEALLSIVIDQFAANMCNVRSIELAPLALPYVTKPYAM